MELGDDNLLVGPKGTEKGVGDPEGTTECPSASLGGLVGGVVVCKSSFH